MRTRLELILSLPSGDSYISSTPELDDLNMAYEATAYAYHWPQLLVKRGARILANNKKYALPTNPGFREFSSLYVLGAERRETDLHQMPKKNRHYAVDRSTSEFIISDLPTANGTQFTISGSPSSGNSVTITLDTVTGLAAGDEIYIDDATNPEVTYVQNVSGSTITARLASSKSSGTVLYRALDNIMYNYFRTVTLLSAGGDVTLLPDSTDYILLYKAAALAYERLEQFDRAAYHENIWEQRLKDFWLQFSKNTAGSATQFIIA